MFEIKVFEIHKSVVNVLHLNRITANTYVILLVFFNLVGLFIKGLFMYFVQFKAPKDRPINKMIFYDQVCYRTVCSRRIRTLTAQ